MDGPPVLAITGHPFHDLIDTSAQQDVELCRVFRDLTVYNPRVLRAARVAGVTDLARRSAIVHRCVAHMNFPVDLHDEQLRDDPRSKRSVEGHRPPIFPAYRILPPPRRSSSGRRSS